tara:strand:+ start:133 stop:324 length:192 start_codon:yes stop_codon:yes gene_type:complete
MDLVSYLLEKIQKRQAEISETLMSNGIRNIEEYQHYMGRVAALGDMEQILKETRNRMETAEDD